MLLRFPASDRVGLGFEVRRLASLVAAMQQEHQEQAHAQQAQAHDQHAGDGAAAKGDLERFVKARAGGLGITVHAGEWGGAAQVRRALELEPARIAHGAPAIDDPGLMQVLRERGVSLDLSLGAAQAIGLQGTGSVCIL